MRRYSVKKYKKLHFIILAVVVVVVIFVIILVSRACHEFETIVSRSVYYKTQDEVYACINRYIGQSDELTDFVIVNKDSNGNITDIQTDSAKINMIKSQLNTEISKTFDNNDKRTIEFPVGTLTGIDIVSGMGADISISCHTIGNINTTLKSYVESCGINQVKYSLYIDIVAEICIILPTESKNITFDEQYLLAETVIVGSIPEVYLNND